MQIPQKLSDDCAASDGRSVCFLIFSAGRGVEVEGNDDDDGLVRDAEDTRAS